jgi:hypothetical protein
MHVTGEIVLHGERIAIDCYSVRDRSWSPRRPRDSARANDTSGGRRPPRQAAASAEWSDVSKPVRKPFNIGYIFGTASPRGDFTNTGYLVRDGVWAHLVEGQRRCLVDPDRGWIWRIEYQGVDTLGRRLEVQGEQVSNHATATGLFHWQWNGVEGWGENQGGIAPSYPRVPRTNP